MFPAKQVTLGGPVEGEELGLFENSLGRLLLLVGRIAVPAQDAFDQHAQMGPDVFPDGPVTKIELIPFPSLGYTTGTVLDVAAYQIAGALDKAWV